MSQNLRTILPTGSHALYILILFTAAGLSAQAIRPVKRVRPDAIDPNYVDVRGATQDSEGKILKLRGAAKIETYDMVLFADEIDYFQDRDYAEARGHVRFDYYESGEHLEADHVEYDLARHTGKFYDVTGSSPARLQAKPGVLTTTSPFSFKGKWAERLQDRYILHDGFVTDCRIPRPWWILTGSTFDVIPGKRVITKNSFFRLKSVPLFYTPRFYKSLAREPRKSGILTPSLTNSNRRGITYGAGYYWAINRSYDAMYRGQLFTQRGFAHNIDFRGKPTSQSDFNYIFYGVNDKGPILDDGSRGPSQGGFLTKINGRAELEHGFRARGEFNYLSSFEFRQIFTDSFWEAISSETHSLGHISKYWSTYGFTVAASRIETFQWRFADNAPGDNKLTLTKLPTVEFNSRDHEVLRGPLPVWVSWDTSYSLVRRHERAFETSGYVSRTDAEPRVMTALRWKDFHLVPAFSIRETHYSASFDGNRNPTSTQVLRSAREFSAELVMPSLSKIFAHPPKLFGTSLKHVIEPRASFRYVGGVDLDFQRLIRFDETELLTNTREVEVSITNRFFSKRQDGKVNEIFSWDLTQRRYLDPTFGGTVLPGQRNVVLSSATLTGFAFIDGPRTYSPLISQVRSQVGGVGIEWRADYDPARSRVVASSLSANGRLRRDYFVSLGHNLINSVPITSDGTTLSGLAPRSNQLLSIVGYGQENNRGMNAGLMLIYDYSQKVLVYNQTQFTYNTDCCGWSVQFRRLAYGARNENQFRFAFNVANIGSFGTLRKQERMF